MGCCGTLMLAQREGGLAQQAHRSSRILAYEQRAGNPSCPEIRMKEEGSSCDALIGSLRREV
jgi:hypothetical protein